MNAWREGNTIHVQEGDAVAVLTLDQAIEHAAGLRADAAAIEAAVGGCVVSAEKLREAAKVERAEWSGDIGGKFDKAARIHLALADWLDVEASRNPEQPIGDGITIGGPLLQALAVADAILGGAS